MDADFFLDWPRSVPCVATTRVVRIDGRARVLLAIVRGDESIAVPTDAKPVVDQRERLAAALRCAGRWMRFRYMAPHEVAERAGIGKLDAIDLVDSIRDVQRTVRNTAALDQLLELANAAEESR